MDYLDPTSINGLNLYAYCNNDPVNMADPSGHFAILSLLIGIGIGALVGVATSIYQDCKDDGTINGSIGGWAYVGSILGGAIAGAGQGMVSTILLGMAGSITNSIVGSGFDPNWNDLIVDCLISCVLSALGYGIGKITRSYTAELEAKALKSVAKVKGNNFVNHKLIKMKAGVNIGMKNINRIANGLFTAEEDFLGISIESIASSIPDVILNLF